MSNETFRVWIGCLACYNNGNLLGGWYDADEAGDVTTSQLHGRDMTRWHTYRAERGVVSKREEIHEELWVMDLDNAPTGCHREMSPMDAQAIADRIAEMPSWFDLDAYAAWCDNLGLDFVKASLDEFEDAYCGEYASREEYAQELAEDIGATPSEHSWPASYIDWAAAARDLFFDYYDIDSPGGIYVFRDC